MTQTQDVSIVEPVELNGFESSLERLETGRQVATSTAIPMEAVYHNKTRRTVITRPVMGFRRDGFALVLSNRKLVDATKVDEIVASDGYVFDSIRESENPPLAGPFTAPPFPLYAVFSEEPGCRPVLFFDVHGRAVCHSEEGGHLYLAQDEDGFVRIGTAEQDE